MIRTAGVFRACAALALCGAIALAGAARAQEYRDIPLADIAANIDAYKGKTITLRLKLKYMDTVFNRLVFYDRKNIDVEFDVEKIVKDRKRATAFLNLHNGMEYLVTFTVVGVGKMGLVMGELGEFVPLALFRLPSGGQ